jgi:hypothetical protein
VHNNTLLLKLAHSWTPNPKTHHHTHHAHTWTPKPKMPHFMNINKIWALRRRTHMILVMYNWINLKNPLICAPSFCPQTMDTPKA